jgi:hypothetical protein
VTRRFRRGYVEVPKKNGKSTLFSGLSLYLLGGDGEAPVEAQERQHALPRRELLRRRGSEHEGNQAAHAGGKSTETAALAESVGGDCQSTERDGIGPEVWDAMRAQHR